MRPLPVFALILMVSLAFPSRQAARAETPSAGGAASRSSTAPTTADAGGIDEAAVVKLIAQLGDDRWRVREDASEKLKAMGPKLVPVLMRHLEHRDAEIASRVNEILEGYKWMTVGAVIVKIMPNSQGERVKMRTGDVVCRVDDADVLTAQNLALLPREKPRTFSILRDGEIKTFQVGPGIVGIMSANWDRARGGVRISRALNAIAQRRYDDAYDDFTEAFKQGGDDPLFQVRFAGLCEYRLEHKRAMDILARVRATNGPMVEDNLLTAGDIDAGFPTYNIITERLLGRMKTEPMSSSLQWELGNWLIGGGRNQPLAREVLGKAPADPGPPLPPELDALTRLPAMFLAAHDRHWERVLEIYAKTPHPTSGYLAIQAAIQLGDVDKAVELGLSQAALCREGGVDWWKSSCVYALGAAWLAGKDPLAGKLAAELKVEADQKDFEELFDTPHMDAMNYPLLNRKFLPLIEPFAATRKYPRVGWRALRMLSTLPELTEEKWRGAFDKYAVGEELKGKYDHLNAWVALRFGRFDKFLALAAAAKGFDPAGVAAAKMLQGHKDRLDKDWAQLKGTIAVFDGARKGAFWAVRYDDHAFLVDAKGQVREYPGLSELEDHGPLGFAHVISKPGGTICVRRSQVYLLDEPQGRWLPTYVASGREPPDAGLWDSDAAPLVLRYAMDHFPADTSAWECLRSGPAPRDWRWWVFNGDIVLLASAKEKQVRDLGHEISALMGRSDRALVYRPRQAGDRLVIPTEAGLWVMDPRGKIARAEIGLKDDDKTAVILDWPVRKGKLYVGVAPQHGGQVFEMDEQTGRFTLTEGYCGIGPEDAFSYSQANHVGPEHWPLCEYALQKIHAKAAKSQEPQK